MSIFNRRNHDTEDLQQMDSMQTDGQGGSFDSYGSYDPYGGHAGYESPGSYDSSYASSWQQDYGQEDDYYPEQQYGQDMYGPLDPAGMQGGGRAGILDFRSSENFMMIMSLILAAVLILASGFLVYKTHALSVENTKLEKRVQRDTKLKKSEDEYETETQELESETDTLINRYGAGNTPEKTIMFLSNLSSTSGLSVTSIEFGDSENVTVDEDGNKLKGAAEAPDPTERRSSEDSDDEEEDGDSSSSPDDDRSQTQKDGDSDKDDRTDSSSDKKSGDEKEDSKDSGSEASSNQYYLYKYQVTFSYTGSYSELKKAIGFIEDYGERTTVNDITSTYDETTQDLTGSITLNMYTLSGTAQQYTAPSVSGSIGNSNIFG